LAIDGSPNHNAGSAAMKTKVATNKKATSDLASSILLGEHCSSAISPLRCKNRNEAKNRSSLPDDCRAM
jgi:hypothetical protein